MINERWLLDRGWKYEYHPFSGTLWHYGGEAIIYDTVTKNWRCLGKHPSKYFLKKNNNEFIVYNYSCIIFNTFDEVVSYLEIIE